MNTTCQTIILSTFLLFPFLSVDAQEKQAQDSTQKLKEVAIIANKNIIKQKSDRIIYNLQADPESKGNSLLTSLRKVPYLSVDGTGNVQMKGSSNFRLLINGKPSAVADGNLKDFLQNIPAATIQNIEVITIPPSKYDAEGLAGLINIITVKKLDNGYSGTVNLTEEFPVGGPGIGGSFNFKQGKFGMSTFAGGGIYRTPETVNSSYRISGPNDQLYQNGRSKSNRRSGYFGTELSYEIDSLNLFSGNFNWSAFRSDGSGVQEFRQMATNSTTEAYRLDNQNNGNGHQLDAAVNYQLGFRADKNRLLTFSYQYSANTNDQLDNIQAIAILNATRPDYIQENQQHSPENTAQIDLVYPVKNLLIESGVKAIFRTNQSKYNDLSGASDELNEQQDLNQADIFSNTQQVFAAYHSYALNLKSWSFQAGLRLEKTVIRADFASNSLTLKQDYLRLVPSIAVNKNFSNNHSLNFGFSQRIKRPGINRLNPFVNRLNPNFESTGNPALRPMLVNDIQAGYNISGKLSINLGLDYSFMRNVDLLVSSYDPATQITRSSYENTGKIAGLGNFLTVAYPLTANWNISLNTQLLYFWIEGEVAGVTQQNNLLTGSAYLSTGYKLKQGWRVNAALNGISRNPTGFQGTSNGLVGISLSVNKELIADKLSLSVSANNPLIKYRDNKSSTTGPDFYQEIVNQSYFSSYRFSLNYNFGGLKEKLKKNKREIRNDDSSN